MGASIARERRRFLAKGPRHTIQRWRINSLAGDRNSWHTPKRSRERGDVALDLRLRTATLDDASAIDHLLHDCALAYLGHSRGSGEALERLSQPGSDPAVVMDATGGSILGFGHVWSAGAEARCFTRVHPDAVGLGVGTALLSHLESRARSLCAWLLNVTQWAADTSAPALLRDRGYSETQFILGMRTPLDGYQSVDVVLPAGVDIAGFDPDRDRAQLFSVAREAFPDEPLEEGEWWHERCEDPTVHFDPSLWLAARTSDDVIGMCLGREQDDNQEGTVGYIADIAVRPAWRGKGIAYALLTRMLAMFAQAGLPAATLDVSADNLTGALRLYRKAGMHPEPSFTVWSLALADPEPRQGT